MAKKDKADKADKAIIKGVTDLMAQITKAHGAGSVIIGDAVVKDLEVISTGSIAIDAAVGVGGFPRGRIIEIFGPESSGKTTLALHAVANVQKTGGVAAYIDAEHALDPTWAGNIGVNMDRLLLSQPNSGEEALQIAEKMVMSGIVSVIVIDSVAALVPQAELDGEIGDTHIGAQARLMGQAMRKLAALTSQNKCIMIFINQIRDKIGVFGPGSNTTTSGGKALKFYASLRIEIKRTGSVGTAGKYIANKIKVKVVKNKVAPPFRIAEFELSFGNNGIYGINNIATLYDYGLSNGTFKKEGNFAIYQNEKIANGRDAAIKWLLEHKDIAEKIETDIKQAKLKERVSTTLYEDALVNGDTSEEEEEVENGD